MSTCQKCGRTSVMGDSCPSCGSWTKEFAERHGLPVNTLHPTLLEGQVRGDFEEQVRAGDVTVYLDAFNDGSIELSIEQGVFMNSMYDEAPYKKLGEVLDMINKFFEWRKGQPDG